MSGAFVIYSTSRGLRTDIECVLFRIGGEPLFAIG